MADDKVAPPSNQIGVVYLQFFARREQDGSFTLCLDSSSADDVPEEIGRGFVAVADITAALNTALTAPAVAEDRMTAVEEYLPALNQTIDSVNEVHDALTLIGDRLRALEEWRDELSRQGAVFAPPTRPQIPRVGELRQPAAGLRRPSVAAAGTTLPAYIEEQRPQTQARTVIGPSTLDEPRPEFNRGEFKPHTPVPRVGRGPGSVG